MNSNNVESFYIKIMVCFFLLGIYNLLFYEMSAGLPRHDEGTKAYLWIQQNIKNSKLYSVGLRPYGLYGDDLTNKVFFDLSTADWSLELGIEKIIQEDVDYIFFHKDPNQSFDENGILINKKPEFPKGIEYFNDNPNIFKKIFYDKNVMGFKVDKKHLSFIKIKISDAKYLGGV